MSNFTTVPDKNVGDPFTQSMWATYIEQNINKGVVRPLADVILGSASATIGFSSIDQNFAHLMIEIDARCDGASEPYDAGLQFNADGTSGHYLSQILEATGTTVSTHTDTTSTYGVGVIVPGLASTANRGTKARIVIPNYCSGSVFQRGWHSAGGYYAAAGHHRSASGAWLSTVPITQITFVNSGGNFIIGSRATLYALPF